MTEHRSYDVRTHGCQMNVHVEVLLRSPSAVEVHRRAYHAANVPHTRRKEHSVGIRQIKTCDVTGAELPDNTQPERLAWAGHSYDLYLSDEGRERLTSFLEPILTDAQEVNANYVRPQQRRTAARRTDLDQIREWARDNGYTVSDRGRIKKEIMDAYDAAK